jgi:hypothetical protein
MGYINELRTGLAGGRGNLSLKISTRYDGLGINAQKFGGKQFTVGETNYASSNKGIAKPGSF